MGSSKKDQLFDRQETRLAKASGGRKQPRSGAGPVEKADVKGAHDGELLIEAKSTIHQSISVKVEYLEKVTHQAAALHRKPALAITFQDMPPGVPQDWIMVPKDVLLGGNDEF
jgi:Holliday junction resolvase